MLWRYSRKDTKVLLLATLLIFSGYALLLGQGWQASARSHANLTAETIGVLAGVDENRVNTYVSQLDERARTLDAREAALLAQPPATDTRTLLAITLVGSGLLGLILLNFYLDSKRRMSLVP
jgi:hypothetical protein